MGRKDFGQTLEELEDLNGVIGVERQSCDCVLRKLEARQAARVAEMNSLRQAKDCESQNKESQLTLLDQRKTQKLWKLAFSIIEAICAEEDTQKTYWSFVKETNAPIDTKIKCQYQ
jgi:hypothetical protein